MASHPSDQNGPTVVSAGMHITGNLISEGDVHIKGCVHGDVHSPRLAVAENGSVLGSVFAEEVVIRGSVKGSVYARHVTLTKTARVALDITYGEVKVEEGAQFEGSLVPVAPGDQLFKPPKPSAPPPRVNAPAASPAAVGARATENVGTSDDRFKPVPRSNVPLLTGVVLDQTPEKKDAESASAPEHGQSLTPAPILAPSFELDADDVDPFSLSGGEPNLPTPSEDEAVAKPDTGAEPRLPLETVENVEFAGISPPESLVETADPSRDAPDDNVETASNDSESRAEGAETPQEIPDVEPFAADSESRTEIDVAPQPEPEPEQEEASLNDRSDESASDDAGPPPVAIPITLQTRRIPPRRRSNASIAVVAILVVAAVGAYFGSGGFSDDEDLADGPDVQRSGEYLGEIGLGLDQKDPPDVPEGTGGPDTTDGEQKTEPGIDEVDAQIQAEIEARRKELEQSQAAVAEDDANTPPAQTPETAETTGTVDSEAVAEADAEQETTETAEVAVEETAKSTEKPVTIERAALPEAETSTAKVIDDFKAGIAASQKDDFDEAIARLAPAIESGKLSAANLAAAYRNRARAHAGKGAFQKAVADYTQTLELKPEDPVAYNNRGYAYNKMDRPRQALSDINRAIELRPNYSYAFSNRCWAYRKLGQQEKAIADCRKALELNPKIDYAIKTLRKMGVKP